MKKIILLLFIITVFTVCDVCFATENKDDIIIYKGTNLVGKLITPISSKYNKVGDTVLFSIDKSLWYDGLEIIPKGSTGRAIVKKAQKAGYFGVSGTIVFEPQSIILRNGVEVPLTFETGKHGSRESDANMIVGVVGFGVFAGFLHGSNQKFPAGTLFYIYIKEDVNVGKYSDAKNVFDS